MQYYNCFSSFFNDNIRRVGIFMQSILVLIGVSAVCYVTLLYLIKMKNIKSINNRFQIEIPILAILVIANVLSSVKYNFSAQSPIILTQNLLASIIIPVYCIYLQYDIKVTKIIKFVFIILSIIFFLKLVIISGVRSIIFPMIYLVCEFIQSNNIKNIKKMKFDFSVSYIEMFNKLSPMDKTKYKEMIIKAVTVFFAIIVMTMMTISKIGFIYQILFITLVSFTFIRNIRTGKFKKILLKTENKN